MCVSRYERRAHLGNPLRGLAESEELLCCAGAFASAMLHSKQHGLQMRRHEQPAQWASQSCPFSSRCTPRAFQAQGAVLAFARQRCCRSLVSDRKQISGT